MICGSTCVLAILVAGCSIPLFEGTTVLLHQELATQELLQEQLCHVTRTCRCCTYLTSYKSQHYLPLPATPACTQDQAPGLVFYAYRRRSANKILSQWL
jgi:hypothetical protein